MLDTIFGLPVHVLVLHAVVIGLPLTALATVAVSARGVWRERWSGWVALLNAAMLVATYVTRQSGQELYDRLDSIGGAAVADDHRRYGLFLIWPMLLLFVLSVLVWFAARQAVSPMVSTVLTVAVAAAAAFTVYWTIRTGHTGSTAVWRDIVKNT